MTPVTPQPTDFGAALATGLTQIGNTALTGYFAEQLPKKASTGVIVAVVAGGGLLLVGGVVVLALLMRRK